MDKIDKTLLYAGVPAHLDGFRYLHDAVFILSQVNGRYPNLTTVVYPMVAENYNTSTGRVERCMRTAVQSALARLSPEQQKEIFGNSLERGKDTISTVQFLHSILLHMK